MQNVLLEEVDKDDDITILSFVDFIYAFPFPNESGGWFEWCQGWYYWYVNDFVDMWLKSGK